MGGKSDLSKLQDINHLLKDISPPLPSIGQVKSALKHLNQRKATAWCLQRYAKELAPVVHDIVTASIAQYKYSTMHKHATVSAIPKIHPPTDFRQVFVLPQIAKIIEKLQLNANKSDIKIKTNQHAFFAQPC